MQGEWNSREFEHGRRQELEACRLRVLEAWLRSIAPDFHDDLTGFDHPNYVGGQKRVSRCVADSDPCDGNDPPAETTAASGNEVLILGDK